MQLRIWSHTDIGNTRSENQDCVYANAPLGLAILADGMGGHNGGEVASQRTVFGVAELLEDQLAGEIADSAALSGLIDGAIREQNRRLFGQAQDDPRLHGMGCTLVVVVIRQGRALIANIGDSRAYLFRDGRLVQITTDHSLVQAQIDSGLITEEEAAESNAKNMLTRAVGVAADVKPDFFEARLQPGDWLMTCSDGMLQCHRPAELQAEMAKAVCRDDPARYLVELAVAAGSTDNVSVQVLAV